MVVCVSRLMPRKGQDVLIRVWPQVLLSVPGAALLIVGGGPYRNRLQRMVDDRGLAGDVVLTGSVPFDELPAHYAAGDLFAMPARTRNRGLDVEGLGIVYLEASATALPVIAGDSGGAPDAVLPGRTGLVVDGRSDPLVRDQVVALLRDPSARTRFGLRGRAWVEEQWSWDQQARVLRDLVDPISG